MCEGNGLSLDKQTHHDDAPDKHWQILIRCCMGRWKKTEVPCLFSRAAHRQYIGCTKLRRYRKRRIVQSCAYCVRQNFRCHLPSPIVLVSWGWGFAFACSRSPFERFSRSNPLASKMMCYQLPIAGDNAEDYDDEGRGPKNRSTSLSNLAEWLTQQARQYC